MAFGKEAMRYGSTIKGTGFKPHDWRVKLIQAVFFFIPKANPDTEALYPLVKKWVLEVEDDGSPIREVALNADGQVLFRAPDGRNLGLWTDEDVKFTEADLGTFTGAEFDELWSRAKPTTKNEPNKIITDQRASRVAD